MRFVDLIEKKKNGLELSSEEIKYWISGYVDGSIPDYQVSALLMAIVFKGMSAREIKDLTITMRDSGDLIDISKIAGVKIDKHSTGGVGDKTSLSLMPMVASCGVKVAKMSGRGLGHTGGTLDKLESINGFNILLTEEQFISQVNNVGIAIIGQTASLVPADKKLYALRDVTGTVKSIPLIASSIMSKKLASGADTILLDVKYGEGAFMSTPEEAIELAKTMIQIGKDCHKDTRAIISDMNTPLGMAIGNSLEVKEAIDTLNGQGPKDFTELCYKAGSIILQQAKIAKDENEALMMLKDSIDSKKALAKLKEMVKAQSGNLELIANPDLFAKSKYVIEMKAKDSGYVTNQKALELGNLAMMLGAGRAKKEDVINPRVGIVLNCKVGYQVNKGDVLARIYTDEQLSEQFIDLFYRAITIAKDYVEPEPLIYCTL